MKYHILKVILLGMCDNCSSTNLPSKKLPIHRRLITSRERLLDLRFISQFVTFCYLGFIKVIEQRLEPLDIVVWALEQIGDGDRVMKARGQSQQHWLCWIFFLQHEAAWSSSGALFCSGLRSTMDGKAKKRGSVACRTRVAKCSISLRQEGQSRMFVRDEHYTIIVR